MNLIKQEDITRNVINAIEMGKPLSKKEYQKIFQNGSQKYLRNSPGKSSRIHEEPERPNTYLSPFVLQKPAMPQYLSN
jgi:hypothetical protein